MAKTAIRRRVKKNKSRKNKRRTMRYMGGDSLKFIPLRMNDIFPFVHYIDLNGNITVIYKVDVNAFKKNINITITDYEKENIKPKFIINKAELEGTINYTKDKKSDEKNYENIKNFLTEVRKLNKNYRITPTPTDTEIKAFIILLDALVNP